MLKNRTSDLIKKEENLYIINMLKAFPEEGLELKHLRFELIGPHDLKKDIYEINEYLERRRLQYIHNIQKGFFNKYSNPLSMLNRCLQDLKSEEHQVIELKQGRYRINDSYNFKKMISTYDQNNINYQSTTQKLEIFEDVGIHLYEFPSKAAFNFCNDKKKLSEFFYKGCKKISEGTQLLQGVIIYICSQIKINIWKKVIDTLSNEEIDLFERKLLFSFFILSLISPIKAESNFYSCFITKYSGEWLNSKKWKEGCYISSDGEFKHRELKMQVNPKPSIDLIDILRKLHSSKRYEDIFSDFSANCTLSKEISDCIISIAMLDQIPKFVGNLCTVSYQPQYVLTRIPNKTNGFFNFAISNELGLDIIDENKKNIRVIPYDELLSDFGPIGGPMHSYMKKRLVYGVKMKGQWSKIFKEAMKKEVKNCKPFSLMLNSKTIDDIFDILKPNKQYHSM